MKGCLGFILVVQTTIALGLLFLAEFTPVPIDIPVGGWVVRLGANVAEAPQAPEATMSGPATTITPLPTLTPTPRPTVTATPSPTATLAVVARAMPHSTPPADMTRDDILSEMRTDLALAALMLAVACILGAFIIHRALRRPEWEVIEYESAPQA